MRHRFSASLVTLSLLLSFIAVPTSALTQIPTEARAGDRSLAFIVLPFTASFIA